MENTAEAISIQEIIEREWISTAFHSLVSIKRKALLGVEALSRCTAPGEDIPPQELFRMAAEAGCLLELDRLCRRKALEAFAPIHAQNRGLILSLNVDGHSIDSDIARSGFLLHTVKACGINPNNVLIEIVESRARDTDALADFVTHYRKNGFLIALDDVGVGHSNLDRIPLLRPDVLKLDRSLVSGVDAHMMSAGDMPRRVRIFSESSRLERMSASCSGVSSTGSASARGVTSAKWKGSSETKRFTLARESPCTSTFRRPSGILSMRMIMPTVPTWYMSFGPGLSTVSSFWDRMRM